MNYDEKFSGVLSQRQNWILGESILLWILGPCFRLIYYNEMVYKDWIDSRFTIVYKGILIITRYCIGDSKQIL